MKERSTARPLVLASASPRRRKLLEEAGFAPLVEPVDADETPPPGGGPEETAAVLAERKLDLWLARRSGGRRVAVIAADTVVAAADGELLAKPMDERDARRMLRKLAGSEHRVVTGVAAALVPEGSRAAGIQVTAVRMRPLTDREIEDYVRSGEGFGKAGGYAIQETADRFVTGIDGDFDNVVGLPLRLVRHLLERLGVPAAVPSPERP